MSTEADALRLSGLFGIARGLLIGLYQMITLDPMLPDLLHVDIPPWMTVTHIHLLGLSIVVLFYSHYLDDLFPSYRRLTAGAAIFGQWVFPLTLYPIIGLGIGPVGIVHNVAGLVTVIVILGFAINYALHGVGSAGV